MALYLGFPVMESFVCKRRLLRPWIQETLPVPCGFNLEVEDPGRDVYASERELYALVGWKRPREHPIDVLAYIAVIAGFAVALVVAAAPIYPVAPLACVFETMLVITAFRRARTY